MISAFLGSSQKSGAKVFSSWLVISISLALTSKILPQRSDAGFEVFDIIGGNHSGFLF